MLNDEETELSPAAEASLMKSASELIEISNKAMVLISVDIEENGKYYKLMLSFRRAIMMKISHFWERLAEYVSPSSSK
jgi:hypothetical protein